MMNGYVNDLYPSDEFAPWNRRNPIDEFRDSATDYLFEKADAVDSEFLDYVADKFGDLFFFDINKDTYEELEPETKAYIRSQYVEDNIDRICYEMAES